MNTRFAEGSLTKIITFTPRFNLFNHTNWPIEIFEPASALSALKTAGGVPPEPTVIPPQEFRAYSPIDSGCQVSARCMLELVFPRLTGDKICRM